MQLVFENLRKDFGSHTVFENISGEINEGDIIGLIGVNGVGKTTLAKILVGKEIPDSGRVHFAPGYAKVLYVEQFPVFEKGISVYDAVLQAALDSLSGKNKTECVEGEVRVKTALNTIGLGDASWYQEAASLSGGEKTKLSLCKVMVRDFDFLLLDEPSNHLDVDSCQALEEYILSLNRPVLIISHDRYFLDSVATKIWELKPTELSVFEGNYSDYKYQKELLTRNAEKEYNKQQAKIKQLQRTINDRKNWYASAHQAAGQNDFARAKAKKHASVLKAKEKQLERLEKNKLEKPKRAPSPAFEVINQGVKKAKLPPNLVTGKKLVKKFGENVILDNAEFCINRGDKIALIGQNGTGKSTLLKMICSVDSQYSGTISVTPSVKIGYFPQDLDLGDQKVSILDYVTAQGASIGDARLLLASLLFRGDQVFKKISTLSMGEKGRVVFARLILSGANLLVLDEPTNYMDIVSREKIEDVLDEYGGAILFVTHDRYFVRRLANKIIKIGGGKLITYAGDYDYFLHKNRVDQDRKVIGEEYDNLADKIRRLECKLAFLGGELNRVQEEGEKERLDEEFITTARELNALKKALENKA